MLLVYTLYIFGVTSEIFKAIKLSNYFLVFIIPKRVCDIVDMTLNGKLRVYYYYVCI